MSLYGCDVWYNYTVKQNIHLLQIQRIALLNIIKCYSAESTEAFCVLSGCMLKWKQAFIVKRICNSIVRFDEIIGKIKSWNLVFMILMNRRNESLIYFRMVSKLDNKVGGALVALVDNKEIDRKNFRLNDSYSVFMDCHL